MVDSPIQFRWDSESTMSAKLLLGQGYRISPIILPYFLFFVVLVITLLRLGVICGWDVILGSSYLDA